ncbi:DUF3180 domain-containing protein [Arthrobacter sp. ISL-30]|uniref:DUF3180 domain-containing protein n=1 Tax=Arthrobacter sp. ISL-30 TaxID=2819109 RepID=UPI001BEC6AE4|nr:DUF3180 domain-containing protein [Arthrobacter sp. ISL-30]MBT2515760.1 DUF3180 domain-containing protein [Arthrobacter sp. ISL-30]
MKALRPVLLGIIVVVVTLFGWLMTLITTRYSLATPVLPASGLITMGLISGLTLILGINVLRWRNGKKKKMLDPILATLTLVLAQSCAYAGAVLLGWHLGILIDLLRIWSIRNDLDIMWLVITMGGGGLVMVVVGLVVERFCRIPPVDGAAEGPRLPGSRRGEAKGEGEYAYRGD